MRLFIVIRKLKGNESGVALLETLVALAVLGLVAVAFLGGLSTAARGTLIADERATAESLAQSQMEYVKSQTYIDDPAPGAYGEVSTPASYDFLGSTAEPLHEPDDGIQKIKVTVNHNGNTVLTVEDYKVDR